MRHSVHRTVAGAISFILFLAAAQGANAQDAASSSIIEEVVVTGYRASLDQALNLKRLEAGAVDAIMAEDIADFPDLNLAESLQRIPGVAITRNAGEGRQISVRGLGPQFTRVRINGMEALATGGGTDAQGGTNRTRGFDFNTFASELFNSIVVRKTMTADIDEGSLGANVDLRAARPFDYDDNVALVSASLGYNDLSEDLKPRAALLVSRRFADDRFGALFSAAYSERSLVDEGSSTVRWQSAGAIGFVPGYAGQTPQAQVSSAFVPRIPRYDAYAHDQSRLGLTASLQWKPSEATSFNLDALYSDFDSTRREAFLEVPNFSTNVNGIQVQDAVVDATNTLVYGVFNNVDIRSELREDELRTRFTQVTLDGTHEFTDRVRLNGLVGFSQSNHDNPKQTTLLFDWNNIPLLTYDYRGNSRLPLLTYGTTDVTSDVNGTPQTGATSTVDSNGWYLSQIRLRPQSALTTFMNYQADLAWDVSDSVTLRGGAQYKDFEFESTEARRSNGTTANQEGVIPANVRAAPISQYSSLLSFGRGLGVSDRTPTTYRVPDVGAAADLFGLFDTSVFPIGTEPSLNNNFTVEEKDTSGWVQADFEGHLGSMPLRGNLGVRYVQTDLHAAGYGFIGGNVERIEADHDYDDTLPALNLALSLTDELILRAAASKVMARAAPTTLAPGVAVTVSGANRNVTAGNPALEPTRATAYDLGLEWYFASESLLGLALFYKDIESRPVQIVQNNQVFSDNPFGIPDSVADLVCGGQPGCSADLPIWNFTSTVNGEGGELKGFEISYQQPFSFLPGAFRNFGTVLNYTGVESEVTYPGGITANLTGMSESSWNATLYYDDGRFSARVSAAYRDQYLTRVPGQNGNSVEGTHETLNVDASASFKVNDMVQITFEGLNLTDEFEDQYVDTIGDRLSYYHHTGREYYLGVRLQF